MSKVLGTFVQKAQGLKNASSKFTSSVAEGNRILPSRNKDADFQLRIDAGHYDSTSKGLNVVLQVNSQAKSPALRDWARKNETHAKLATATFDTAAVDKDVEFQRVLEALVAEGKISDVPIQPLSQLNSKRKSSSESDMHKVAKTLGW